MSRLAQWPDHGPDRDDGAAEVELNEESHLIPAGAGLGLRLGAGDLLRVVNTHGGQVVDLWAFVDAGEHLSLEHSREVLATLKVRPGDTLLTNRYRPVLRIEEDRSPGDHDGLIAACNPLMFARAGRAGRHPNCEDNLRRALADAGVTTALTPCPLNLFMRATPAGDGRIAFERCRAAAGDFVSLRAEAACVVALSACPDDVYPTNGGDGRPRDAEARLRRATR